MPAIRTVLCPVDFSPATERQLGLALDLCRAFRAKLVLHHNLESAAHVPGVNWMWAAKHHGSPSDAVEEEQLQKLLNGLPAGIEAEARITHGAHSTSVAAVSEVVGADLVVLTTHGEAAEDHTSVTEQLLERAGCAVLALHDAHLEARLPAFSEGANGPQGLLVPTDFSADSTPAVELALKLARRPPFEVHLLHVVATPAGASEPGTDVAESARRRLEALVPEELREKVHLHLETGDPGAQIAAAAERLGACCIVMGEHARGAIRRWFTRDTSRQVLHAARCPIWYVPRRVG